MGIHAADHPIVERQDEDCFDAWLRRKQKEKDEPWAFSSEVDGSSLRDYLSVNNDEWVNVWAWVVHLCLLVKVFDSVLCSSDIRGLSDNTHGRVFSILVHANPLTWYRYQFFLHSPQPPFRGGLNNEWVVFKRIHSIDWINQLIRSLV